MKHVPPKVKGLLTLAVVFTLIAMQSAFSQTTNNDVAFINAQLSNNYSVPITTIVAPPSEKNTISMFPNPVFSNMTIQSSQPIHLISIVDILGRTVMQFQPDKPQVEINIQDLLPGRYFISIRQQAMAVPIVKSFIKI